MTLKKIAETGNQCNKCGSLYDKKLFTFQKRNSILIDIQDINLTAQFLAETIFLLRLTTG